MQTSGTWNYSSFREKKNALTKRVLAKYGGSKVKVLIDKIANLSDEELLGNSLD